MNKSFGIGNTLLIIMEVVANTGYTRYRCPTIFVTSITLKSMWNRRKTLHYIHVCVGMHYICNINEWDEQVE